MDMDLSVAGIFLFKGAMIRNVKWIVGVVVYTGVDTKIQ
jgi:magnesium-transporting ATPase (P-type)